MKFVFDNVVAIIPARGGSKRIPRKNIRNLGGKPLVCHTIDKALESECFDKIILSSDDEEILGIADHYGDQVGSVQRESDWASDKTTIFSYLHHLVGNDTTVNSFEAISLLLPTAPFRSIGSIRNILSLLSPKVDSVVSLSQFKFPPQFSVWLNEGNNEITPVFDPSPMLTGNTRSQDQKPMLHPNGAVFVSWMKSYQRTGSFYTGKCLGYEMPIQESVDIDTEADFQYAEYLYGRNGADGKS